MANKYSKLFFERDKLCDWITIWCEQNLEGGFSLDKKDSENDLFYEIKNGQKTIKIRFIKCSNGCTTIVYKVGTEINISEQLAEYIYSRVKALETTSQFSNGFSLKLNKEEFDTVIDLLKEMNNVSLLNFSQQLETGKAQYYLYRFKGEYNDNVTIKYYINTSRMQMQGKPYHLFNEIVSLVSESGIKLNEVVDAHIKYCAVNVSNEDIQREMKEILGENAYSFMNTSQKAILSTAFILSKIDITMPDYSGIVQQALRSLEGYTKKILNENGIIIEGKQQLGEYFQYDDTSASFCMKNEYSVKVSEEVENATTKMYIFYHKQRHQLMHATASDLDTKIIPKREIADEIFREVLYTIKSGYNLVYGK